MNPSAPNWIALYTGKTVECLCVCVVDLSINKAGYTATPVACGWAGATFEVSGTFGQEQ